MVKADLREHVLRQRPYDWAHPSCIVPGPAPITSYGRQNRSRSEDVASKKMADGGLPVIAHFEVRHRNYLAPDGSINRPLPVFASDAKLLVALYEAMVLLRIFDRKAVALQRTGRLGTYAVSLGQEAVSVGTASAMGEEDVLLPSYREIGRASCRERVL